VVGAVTHHSVCLAILLVQLVATVLLPGIISLPIAVDNALITTHVAHAQVTITVAGVTIPIAACKENQIIHVYRITCQRWDLVLAIAILHHL